MAQFRQNHGRENKGLQTTFRMVVGLIFVFLALVGGGYYFKNQIDFTTPDANPASGEDYSLRTFLPTSTGEIVHHKYY